MNFHHPRSCQDNGAVKDVEWNLNMQKRHLIYECSLLIHQDIRSFVSKPWHVAGAQAALHDTLLNSSPLDKMATNLADDIFNRIFLNENVWILIKISLKFVPRDTIDNIPPLVQIMAWRRPGEKPLSEPMVVRCSASVSEHIGSQGDVIVIFKV